ncbi:MAG: hypothetical protein CMD53_04575 [Gammaproteobacteria bacterium]|nr:hypothetical protein [Gammaproteobacteria bacterium]
MVDSSCVYVVNAVFRLPSVNSWQQLSEVKTSLLSPIQRITDVFWQSRDIVIPNFDTELFGGILSDPFFADISDLGISRKEWQCMDPQQRHCLSLAQELLSVYSLPKNTSVFIGATDTGWSQYNTLPSDNRFLLTGCHLSMMSARISYHFDFTSKSKTIDTSCSSSLVAIVEAFQSIQAGESDFSICGGVNLFNDPFKFEQLYRMNMLSPDHRCFTFKSTANGYVRSEGGILFLLASENGINKLGIEPIAKIHGAFINHDGLSPGITAPSLDSQYFLHQHTLSSSNLVVSDIGYVECHGTGTPLGDPIELKALNKLFSKTPIVVGSLKSKIGHLESAAGAAGLLSCLSLFKDGNVSYVDSSPSSNKFSFLDSCLTHSSDSDLLQKLKTIDKTSLVSSFGFSGTNASLAIQRCFTPSNSLSCSVALFPGQGKFSPELGLSEYLTSTLYHSFADQYWSQISKIISSDTSLHFSSNFSDRHLISPLIEQLLSLVHMLSLYDVSIHNGDHYDKLIGYSFGEYVAAVADNSISFDDCVKSLIEREKIVNPLRDLFGLYYAEHNKLTTELRDKYFLHEVIKCSPDSSIYAVSSSLDDLIKSDDAARCLKYVGVNYCYHSSLLVDLSSLPLAFFDFSIQLSDASRFVPSWYLFPPKESLTLSLESHFLEMVDFSALFNSLNLSQFDHFKITEISSKVSLRRICDQNITLQDDQYSCSFQPNEDSTSLDNSNSSSSPTVSVNLLQVNSSIANFILEFISTSSGVPLVDLDTSKSFTRCGLDSLELAQLAAKLTSKFSIVFPLDELIGQYQVIQEAIDEASRRYEQSPVHSDEIQIPPYPNKALTLASQSEVPVKNDSTSSTSSKPSFSRAEVIHSIDLSRRLFSILSSSRENRNSDTSLADPRYSAGYSSLYRDIQLPLSASKASGSAVYSIDNIRYLDFTMGFGVQLFGHNAEFIKSSLLSAIDTNAFFIGPQSNLAVHNAKLLCELTGHDRALFCNTGTEAVMTAVRLARAYTNRTKILQFNGSYHGHNDMSLALQVNQKGDSVPSSKGVPSDSVINTVLVDYEDEESISSVIYDNRLDLAAILVEPIQSRQPSLNKGKILRLLRRLCDLHGIILIFDEVLIGFRCHVRSSFGFFGVKSDLSTYGKIIGGGLPIGAVAGNTNILNYVDGGAWHYYNTEPSHDRIFFAGTFNKNPLTMSSCKAVLEFFVKDKGALQYSLNRTTRDLCKRLNAYFTSKSLPIRILYASSFFRFIGAPLGFYLELLERKVYIWEGRTCFLSEAHSSEDLDYFEQAVIQSINSLIKFGMLNTPSADCSDIYLLAPTQLTLCAAYDQSPLESQSFNQTVSICFKQSSEILPFLSDATYHISRETSLFGNYDIVSSSFIAKDSLGIDWIYHLDNSSNFNISFSPSNDCHVCCLVYLKNNNIHKIFFSFAHYAIDGKGINTLFQKILHSTPTPSSLQLAYSPVDRTSEFLDQLSPKFFHQISLSSKPPERVEFQLDSLVRQKLVEISESYSITLPSLLLAIYIQSIQSYLDLENFIVAIFGTNLVTPEIAYLYDSFVTPLPLVIDSLLLFESHALSELQNNVSKIVFNTTINNSSLASKFSIKKPPSKYPLSDIAFNYDKISSIFSNSSFDIRFNDNIPDYARWGLFLNIIDDSNSLRICIDFDPSIINKLSIDQIFDIFSSHLDSTDSFPSKIFSNESSLPKSVITSFDPNFVNFTPKNYLSFLTSKLDSHSLSSHDQSLSCKEFHSKLSQYSSFIILIPDSILCIKTSSSLDQILLILSCWNSGKSYLLWNFLENDLTNSSRLFESGINTIISIDSSVLCKFSNSITATESIVVDFSNLAHLIFTSGSTGKSKPVPISIHHLANYQSSIVSRLSLSVDPSKYRYGILSSLNFDFPFTTLLLWLHHGGELFISDSQVVKSSQFWQNIPDNYFSLLKLLPPYFLALTDIAPLSKVIPTDILIFGGDSLSSDSSRICFDFNPQLSIYTHYGPTETCIGCSTFKVNPNLTSTSKIPVGTALDGYTIDIVKYDFPDNSSFIETIDFQYNIGLISITSKFSYGKYFDGSTDSFTSSLDQYTFLTSDLGYFDQNNELIILGRVGGLLKINGYRVYLSDVSNRISSILPSLNFYLLPVPQNSDVYHNSDQIILFYVDELLNLEELQSQFRIDLPNYYCPHYFIPVDCIPLNPNGKVDTDALINSFFDNLSSSCSLSSSTYSSSEKSFIDACLLIFPNQSLSLSSNFYSLGGDSLSAIRLSASLSRSGFDISSDSILVNPLFQSIFDLASHSSNTLETSRNSNSTVYRLTPAQKYVSSFFDVYHWYFTFLISTPKDLSDLFSRRIISILSHSQLFNYNFTANSVVSFNRAIADINLSKISFDSYESMLESLVSVADSSIAKLNPSQGVNLAISSLTISNSSSDYILIALPHYLFDYLSVQLIIDSLSDSSSKVNLHSLGLPESNNLDHELAHSFFQNVLTDQPCILSAPFSFRQSFQSSDFCIYESSIDYALISLNNLDHYSSYIFPFLVRALSSIFTDNTHQSILFDIELASRQYSDPAVNSALGYFSLHAPCVFEKLDNTYISDKFRTLNSIAPSLVSYLANNSSSFPMIPFCSLNLIEHVPINTSTITSIVKHSLSSFESLPLPWSPLMIEVTSSSCASKFVVYYDKSLISTVQLDSTFKSLHSMLSDSVTLSDNDESDIMNRLGW